MNWREIIAEVIVGCGVFTLSAASVGFVKDLNPPVIAAVVGINLVIWGVLLLNARFGNEDKNVS